MSARIASARSAPPSLRPAPASMTPAIVGRLLTLADLLAQAPEPASHARTGAYPFLNHRTAAELALPLADKDRPR